MDEVFKRLSLTWENRDKLDDFVCKKLKEIMRHGNNEVAAGLNENTKVVKEDEKEEAGPWVTWKPFC
jgi:hypothetical protein